VRALQPLALGSTQHRIHPAHGDGGLQSQCRWPLKSSTRPSYPAIVVLQQARTHDGPFL
jgi:hypothetical protein